MVRSEASSRRQFLQRTAIAGGAVWAAPAISSITAARAGAVSGPPCTCSGVGNALLGTVTIAGAEVRLGGGCTPGPVDVPPVGAQILPCIFDANTCTETVEVAGLSVGSLLVAEVISSSATASAGPDACTFTGSAIITDLAVLGTRVTATGAINQTTLVSPARSLLSATVVFNEQACSATTLTVNAVHVTITGPDTSVDLIVAQSRATSCLTTVSTTTTTTTHPGTTTTTEPATTSTTEPETTTSTTTEPETTTSTTTEPASTTTTTGGSGVSGVEGGSGGTGAGNGTGGSSAGGSGSGTGDGTGTTSGTGETATTAPAQVGAANQSRPFGFTGAEIAGMATVAGVSTAAGLAAVGLARRRRDPSDEPEDPEAAGGEPASPGPHTDEGPTP